MKLVEKLPERGLRRHDRYEKHMLAEQAGKNNHPALAIA